MQTAVRAGRALCAVQNSATFWARTAEYYAGVRLCCDWRADQHHGLAEIFETDFERRFRRRVGGGAAAGPRRRQHARRQYGRRDDRFRSDDDALLEFDRKRTGDRTDSDHDRQLEVERDRGRAQMRAGESGREFDQLEKRRRRISAPGTVDQALRSGRHRDGVR